MRRKEILNPAADQNHVEWEKSDFGFDQFCGRAEVEYRVCSISGRWTLTNYYMGKLRPLLVRDMKTRAYEKWSKTSVLFPALPAAPLNLLKM